jgi:hypothetical protein
MRSRRERGFLGASSLGRTFLAANNQALPSVDFSLTQQDAASSKLWRPRPELNRGKRFCRPLRNHSATWPYVLDM